LVEAVVQADDEVDDLFPFHRDDLHKAMIKDSEVIVEASYSSSSPLSRADGRSRRQHRERVYFVENRSALAAREDPQAAP